MGYARIGVRIHSFINTCNARYPLLGAPCAHKYVLKDLAPLQNDCLRAITAAYKATPIRDLEIEVGFSPLEIHLESIQAVLGLRRLM